MSKKLRYLLITLGFLVFLILAPAIVMYVRGISFDFAKKQFVQTGILAIRTQPQDTEVYLDGKLASGSAKDLKFLIPKDYSVSLRKGGYQTWEKRLTVSGGQVAWARPDFNDIFLFLSAPKTYATAGRISDFALSPAGNLLAALSQNTLTLSQIPGNGSSATVILPKPATQIAAAFNGSRFIVRDASAAPPTTLYVDAALANSSELSGLFSDATKWYFSQNGRLYGLNDGNFYVIDPRTPAKTLEQTGVKAAAFLDGDLYLLKQKPTGLSLEVTTGPGQDSQEILSGLPEFASAEIFINAQKQAFILGDGALYRVGGSLEPLAPAVTGREFNQAKSSLIFFHDGELDYINPSDSKLYLISRRGGQVSNPVLRLDMNYSFFLDNGAIKALELDTRDHQNEFDLYEGADIKKLAISGDGRALIILDGDSLKLVAIR